MYALHVTFRSPSFYLGAKGRTAEILNGLNFIQSVTDIIFLLIFTTVNGLSHLPVRSLNNLTRTPGRIRYLVAGGSLDCNALLILDSATMVYISALAIFRASNLSFCSMLVLDGLGKMGKTPYKSNDVTSLLRPIVSLIEFIAIIKVVMSGSW